MYVRTCIHVYTYGCMDTYYMYIYSTFLSGTSRFFERNNLRTFILCIYVYICKMYDYRALYMCGSVCRYKNILHPYCLFLSGVFHPTPLPPLPPLSKLAHPFDQDFSYVFRCQGPCLCCQVNCDHKLPLGREACTINSLVKGSLRWFYWLWTSGKSRMLLPIYRPGLWSYSRVHGKSSGCDLSKESSH